MHAIVGQTQGIGKLEVLAELERKIRHGRNGMSIKEPVSLLAVLSVKPQAERRTRPAAHQPALSVALEVED